jgi:hypothetical protein
VEDGKFTYLTNVFEIVLNKNKNKIIITEMINGK